MNERTSPVVAISITDHGVEVDPLGDVGIHPAAELFPLIEGEEFDALVADIREHDLREPIVFTPGGQLLDGRNRWRACKAAGVKPVTRTEHGEPWAFVISANLHRRHLTEPQREWIAAQIADLANGVKPTSAKLQRSGSIPTQKQAAELLGVSVRNIAKARAVKENGVPELQELMRDGKVRAHFAERASRLSDEAQAAVVQEIKNGADPRTVLQPEPRPDRAPSAEQPARTDNRSPDRHQHLTVTALRRLGESLTALDLVLRNTDGLDPSITSEEAARWAGDLSKKRGAIARVFKLLDERKESNQ